MKRLVAAMVLACLGITLPLAACPLRLCLVDGRVLVPGIDRCADDKSAPPDCCKNCQPDPQRDPCCLDLEEMPDAPAPTPPDELVAPPSMDLPPPAFVAPPPVMTGGPVHLAATPIRGPDSPAARRALLGVWRL